MKVSVRADMAPEVVQVTLSKVAKGGTLAWDRLATLLAGAVNATASQCSFWFVAASAANGHREQIPSNRFGVAAIQTMEEGDVVVIVVDTHPAAAAAARAHRYPKINSEARTESQSASAASSAASDAVSDLSSALEEAELSNAASHTVVSPLDIAAPEEIVMGHQEIVYRGSHGSSPGHAGPPRPGPSKHRFSTSSGVRPDATPSDGSDTLLADDFADRLSTFGSEGGDSERAPSTVRSDYGEESGKEDSEDFEPVRADDDLLPIDLPSTSLLQMVADGTLPRGRLVIPNRAADIGRYTTMAEWQVAAELHEQIISERKREEKVVLRLTPRVTNGQPEITIRAPKPGKKTKSVWKKEISALSGCLLELRQEPAKSASRADRRNRARATAAAAHAPEAQPKIRIVLFVESVGRRNDDELLQCTWVVGADAKALPEAPTLFDFINLGFARPSINKFGAAQELGDRETALGDLLACPQQVRRRSDEDELQWEDVIDDPDKFSSESVDDDIVDASERRSVPINRQQFSAIKRIGCDRIALIQGPPGTGKSTTIFNAIKYRLPPLKQAIVTAVTNQAVAAVLEKFVQTKCYSPLPDCRTHPGPLADAPEGRFSFALCCSSSKLEHLLPEAQQFHIDAITNRLVDERKEVRQVALQFKQFESALESKTELEKRWRTLFFHKGRKDRSRSWRRSYERHILNQAPPQWQAFADAELAEPVGTGVPGQVEFQAPKCRSFDDFRRICLELWHKHIQWVRQEHFYELKRHVRLNSDVVLCTIDTMHGKAMRELWRGASSGRLHSIYIDEASLVPEEAMPIIALFDPVTLALIGDHEQLRPFSKLNYNLTTGEDKRFNRSFFERCVDCDLDYTMLMDNYRNPPDLVAVLNTMTYDGALVAHRPPGDRPSIEWVNHAHTEAETTEGHPSSHNPGEVNHVRKLYNKLKKAGEKSILIITFYKGQYEALQQDINLAEEDGDRICTVDSCQGTEARTVIISCVRSNCAGRVGFTTHPNRLNVAISRTQERLILVGNKATFLAPSRRKQFKNQIWANLVAAIEHNQ